MNNSIWDIMFFFRNINIFHRLKLEIMLDITALNELNRETNNSATRELNIVPLELEGAKLPLHKVAVQHPLTPRGRLAVYVVFCRSF